MARVFIEARPRAGEREAQSRITSSRRKGIEVPQTFKTQGEAITWAKSEGHSPASPECAI